MTEARRGLAYGIGAYGLWGLAPLYWKQLRGASPLELIAHRVVWGLIAFAAMAWLASALPAVRRALADRRTVAVMALSGALLVVNWVVFVSAVATGHILDASLGYFMNPLISVALGMIVLGERMRPLQWVAIALAFAGVVVSWQLGRAPWSSLVLAVTFGIYGLLRKTARVDSLAGSTVETAVIAPLAVIFLGVLAARGDGQLGHASLGTHLLLIATGAVTAVPLLLFTSAARRLPLSTTGFLQYLAPSGQLLLAVAVYDEEFSRGRAIAFALIWLGLIAFSVDLVRTARSARISRTDP